MIHIFWILIPWLLHKRLLLGSILLFNLPVISCHIIFWHGQNYQFFTYMVNIYFGLMHRNSFSPWSNKNILYLLIVLNFCLTSQFTVHICYELDGIHCLNKTQTDFPQSHLCEIFKTLRYLVDFSDMNLKQKKGQLFRFLNLYISLMRTNYSS